MRKETHSQGLEIFDPESSVEQRVSTVQRGMHTRVGEALEWIDTQVDAVAQNIGDAVWAGMGAFGKRLMKWEHPKKEQK